MTNTPLLSLVFKSFSESSKSTLSINGCFTDSSQLTVTEIGEGGERRKDQLRVSTFDYNFARVRQQIDNIQHVVCRIVGGRRRQPEDPPYQGGQNIINV